MSVGRRSWAPRDQEPTRFTPVLGRLCESTAVLGAALVDRLGETVDYAGYVAPFDLKVAAAEWRLVLERLACASPTLAWPDTHELVVRAARLSFIGRAAQRGLRPGRGASQARRRDFSPGARRGRPGALSRGGAGASERTCPRALGAGRGTDFGRGRAPTSGPMAWRPVAPAGDPWSLPRARARPPGSGLPSASGRPRRYQSSPRTPGALVRSGLAGFVRLSRSTRPFTSLGVGGCDSSSRTPRDRYRGNRRRRSGQRPGHRDARGRPRRERWSPTCASARARG